MTHTMREQLRQLVEQFRGRLLSADIADVRCIFDKFDLQQLESILATPEPAVFRCNICGGLVQMDGTKPSVNIGPGGKQT